MLVINLKYEKLEVIDTVQFYLHNIDSHRLMILLSYLSVPPPIFFLGRNQGEHHFSLAVKK